jgi:hypothetical protein
VRDWLGVDVKRANRRCAAAPSGRLALTDAFSEESGDDQIIVADTTKDSYEDYVKNTENAPSDFHVRMKGNAKTFSRTDPGDDLSVIAICNLGADRLLNRKFFVAGEKYTAQNNARTAQGKKRVYRVLESHYCGPEKKCAGRAVELLCSSEPWEALRLEARNMRTRCLATRLLLRQIGGLKAVCVVPGEQITLGGFEFLYGDPAVAERISGTKRCLRCDFWDYYLKKYPSGPKLLETESQATGGVIADDTRTEASRSENGHARWKLIAKMRSLTHPEHFHNASNSVIMHQQRVIERGSGNIANSARRRGRRPQPKLEKVAKTPRTGKKVSKKRKSDGLERFRHGHGGAWKVFQGQKNKR